jgi:hypothetical protein
VAAAPRIELHPSTPWALRLFDRIPLAPLWVGIGIGLAVFLLFLVYTTVLGEGVGRLGEMKHSSLLWVAELIQDLFIGFTLAREMLTYARGTLLAVGLVVGAGSALLTATDPSLWPEGRMPHWTHPTVVWLTARNFVNWWVVSRAMALELMLGRAFSRLGDRLVPVDLLDRSPLAPFGRRALRNVLFWMLIAAFLSLTYLGEGWATDLMVLALLTLGAFAVAAFLLPLAGAHRRIRDLKQVELARVRAAIREARDDALAPGSEGPTTGGRLADLVSYEARIAAVAAWPIDASMLLRFGLYLAIGFGSWIGAALVERALDTALQ